MVNVNINGTRHDLSPEQVDDIISQAFHAVECQRRRDHADTEIAVSELDEAFVSYGVLPPGPEY